MNTASVVEQQVGRNRVCSFLTGPEMRSVDAFHLERLEERLSAGVVIGCARTAHALDSADGRDLAPEVPRGILAAAIRVDHQPLPRMPVRHGVSEGSDSKRARRGRATAEAGADRRRARRRRGAALAAPAEPPPPRRQLYRGMAAHLRAGLTPPEGPARGRSMRAPHRLCPAGPSRLHRFRPLPARGRPWPDRPWPDRPEEAPCAHKI